MEKHLFKFGGRSWALVIPKAWVEKNRLDEKSIMHVNEYDSGSMVISSKATTLQDAELVITSEISPQVAGRWVDIYYRSGVKRLRVYAKNGAPAQFREIEGVATRLCPGFEVISRSKSEIMLEDFTDMGEVSVEKIINRLRSLIAEELIEIGKEEREEIEKLEGLVNRFFTFGIRCVNIIQGKDSTKNFKILQLLETISDQIYELSAYRKVTKNAELFDRLGKILDLSFKGVRGDKQAIEDAIKIRNLAYKALEKEEIGDLGSYLVREIAKNMIKISEFGLQTSDPKSQF